MNNAEKKFTFRNGTIYPTFGDGHIFRNKPNMYIMCITVKEQQPEIFFLIKRLPKVPLIRDL
jgi:hypothetical protein